MYGINMISVENLVSINMLVPYHLKVSDKRSTLYPTVILWCSSSIASWPYNKGVLYFIILTKSTPFPIYFLFLL